MSRKYYKPLPPTEMAVLARYLGEITCREFAREHPIIGHGVASRQAGAGRGSRWARMRFDVGRYSGCSAGVLRGVGAGCERVLGLGAALGCVPHCRDPLPIPSFCSTALSRWAIGRSASFAEARREEEGIAVRGFGDDRSQSVARSRRYVRCDAGRRCSASRRQAHIALRCVVAGSRCGTRLRAWTRL